MIRFYKDLERQQTILDSYRSELKAKKITSESLIKKQPGYQNYGDFA